MAEAISSTEAEEKCQVVVAGRSEQGADRGEEGYEHRWDSALAAYFWLLADTAVRRSYPSCRPAS